MTYCGNICKRRYLIVCGNYGWMLKDDLMGDVYEGGCEDSIAIAELIISEDAEKGYARSDAYLKFYYIRVDCYSKCDVDVTMPCRKWLSGYLQMFTGAKNTTAICSPSEFHSLLRKGVVIVVSVAPGWVGHNCFPLQVAHRDRRWVGAHRCRNRHYPV